MSERISIGEAAAEQDVPIHVLVSWFHRSGALLLIPDSEDARCILAPGDESHMEDCECRFLAAHPDIGETEL